MRRDLLTGAVAGAIGTAAMTAGQTAEMRITGRPPSMVPGHVASKLFRLNPADDAALARISLRMHWAHGVSQGAVRAALGRLGVRGATGAAAHLALMWTGDVVMYRMLGISPWPWEWSFDELASDVVHKGVYVLATGAAYDRLRQ